MDICVAHSQGGIGYLLMQAIENALREVDNGRHVASLLTQVEVDAERPGLPEPDETCRVRSSPKRRPRIGRELGWLMREDSGRGWRHVVPSPKPRHICRYLAHPGARAARHDRHRRRGGGIPVVRGPKGVRHGVAAVIDKDLTSAHMANVLGIDNS